MLAQLGRGTHDGRGVSGVFADAFGKSKSAASAISGRFWKKTSPVITVFRREPSGDRLNAAVVSSPGGRT